MAYNRYDKPRMRRQNRFEDQGVSGYGRFEYRRPSSDLDYDREERDFFDRARDEVKSWFGDELAERRRELDRRFEDDFEYRIPRFREEGYRRPYTGRRYDYSPTEGRQWSNHNVYGQGGGLEPNQIPTSAGVTTEFGNDYDSWRQRQIEALDRDYCEWRSENLKRFDDEFTSWRQDRQKKRELMRQIPDHAEVIGSDGKTVGTVDALQGDRIILTKSDSPDGKHHSLNCSCLDQIEKGKVKLNIDAQSAKQMWRDEQLGRTFTEGTQRDFGGQATMTRNVEPSY